LPLIFFILLREKKWETKREREKEREKEKDREREKEKKRGEEIDKYINR